MKVLKVLTVSLSFILTLTGNAQVRSSEPLSDVIFSTFEDEYKALNGEGPFSDHFPVREGDTLDLPFRVKIAGQVFHRVVPTSNGLDLIPYSIDGFLKYVDNTTSRQTPNDMGYTISSESWFETDGIHPDRVIKYQHHSLITFDGENQSRTEPLIYRQIWIHENGCIQVRYGSVYALLDGAEDIRNSIRCGTGLRRGLYAMFIEEEMLIDVRSIYQVGDKFRLSAGRPEGGKTLPVVPGTVFQFYSDSNQVEQPFIAPLVLSPNPSEDFFRLDGPPGMKWEFKIVDITGKEVESGVVMTNEEYSIYELPSGTYTLELFNETNGFRRAEKLVVE